MSAQIGARSRDLGCRCFSAATGGSPGMAAGLGCCPGELCARPWGIPGGRHCPWGLACAAGLEPLLLCRAGAGGQQLLSRGLMLWDAPAPPSSASGDPTRALGKVLLPGCHTAGQHSCSHVELLLAPGEWYLHVPRAPGLHPPLPEPQGQVRWHSSGTGVTAVVLDWSAAGPDPATTRLNDVP